MRRFAMTTAAFIVLLVPSPVYTQAPLAGRRALVAPAPRLDALIEQALAVAVPTRSAAEYAAAARALHDVLDRLKQVDRSRLDLDNQVDYDLLDADVRTQLFEIETIKLYQVDAASYLELGRTNALFLRPGAASEVAVRRAVAELRRLPQTLEHARVNLTTPARVWTEFARSQAYYARLLLETSLPDAEVEDAALKQQLLAAGAEADRAVVDYEAWLTRELLPRSTRSPAWKPEELEFYQFVHEQLPEYGVDEMIRVAAREERVLMDEMAALARRIHPSGDLRTVWQLMNNEAPPWDEVLPMAQQYVDTAAAWLRGPGSRLLELPDFDFGARITPPMARLTLPFGGSMDGPTVAGRQSGYYVLTPLEDRLTPAEKASRIKAYNPYWTHVISYHEWVGHNVQRALADRVTRPMRRAFRSIYFSQAWSFYLEKLMEDEGYYRSLPYMERLKTEMARRQMRMWRVQRILTKCRMAKGEMTFEQAVEAYVQNIGMERANAFIEVQKHSRSPSPPGGREIIGERVILALRDEYRTRMGDHYSLKRFHDALLQHGDLPFRQVRRLIFGE